MCKRIFVFVLISVTFALVGCGGGSSSSTPDSPAPVGGANLIGGAAQGKALSLTNTVSTVTGSATADTFQNLSGIATDGTNLYIADSNAIRKVVISTGAMTTIAGTVGVSGAADGTGAAARFKGPTGITTDGTNLFVVDSGNYTIRKVVILTGVVTTLAGAGTSGVGGTYGVNDGIGTAAYFINPKGITTDGANLFVTDGNSIRKIEISTRKVTTIAGYAKTGGFIDGTGSGAYFTEPHGITTDGTNLYVTERLNNAIRKVAISSGVVTTIAGGGMLSGSGSTDGTGSAARFNGPTGIHIDGANLYVADNGNHTIRKIVISTGVVTTMAGTAGVPGSTDGIGAAAGFNFPYGIISDGTSLFVSDYENHTIRKISISTGTVTTIAGNSTDQTTRLHTPAGITTDGTNLYIAESLNNTIRKVVIATGVVTTIAGAAQTVGSVDGVGEAARFNNPNAITTDGISLFVADALNCTIRKIVISTGEVTTIAGAAGVSDTVDGIGGAARFRCPLGITTDGANLFVADGSSIRKIVISTGVVTTIAGTASASGSADGIGSNATFSSAYGITYDGTNLFVTEYYDHTVRKVVISTGVVTTLAGTAGVSGSFDGIGGTARFNSPYGITTDGTSLFVADSKNNSIRKIDISTGAVTTIVGTAGVQGFADGVGAAALLFGPDGITTDGINLYVCDGYNNSIRKIQ